MILLDTEKQLLQYIKENPEIYIYGGGKVAKLLLKRLERYKIKWNDLITTQGTKTADRLHTVKFDDISAALQKLKPLIIVATKEIFHEEVRYTLEQKEILNAVYLSDRLIAAMKRIQNKRFKFQTHIVEHCNLKCRGCCRIVS